MTERFGLGWIPDVPDWRDHAADNSHSVKSLYGSAGVRSTANMRLPATCDLRSAFSPIENQGSLGSCTSQAGVGLLEYFERKTHGKYVNHSRLFGYFVTRRLMGLTGDTGASLRDTMKAMVRFGLPEESAWPYRIADFDREPTAYVFALAATFKGLEYHRLDTVGTSPPMLLERVKANLSVGLPSMFGFSVFSSIEQAGGSGEIPFPAPSDRLAGGHAVVACGYSDSFEIKNANSGTTTTGALLIRNSWGTGWGSRGYGWLPYDYVLRGLALDWWSLVRADWIDLDVFK